MKQPAYVIAATSVALTCAVVLAACNSSDSKPESAAVPAKPSVVTAFYPLQWVTQQVGGPAIDVSSITRDGAEPHDVTLDARAIETMEKAKLVIYLGDSFQPDVEKIVSQLPPTVKRLNILDIAGMDLRKAPSTPEGAEPFSGQFDPHVWVDPVRMTLVAKAVADELRIIDATNGPQFDAGLQAVNNSLTQLDASTRTRLTNCARRTVVTSHAAFGYFADRYQLTQIPIAGVSPEQEPDAKTLENIATTARATNTTTVYFEDALPSKLASTVATEIGAKTDVLSAFEFAPSGGVTPSSYIDLQVQNVDRLVQGLDCATSK